MDRWEREKKKSKAAVVTDRHRDDRYTRQMNVLLIPFGIPVTLSSITILSTCELHVDPKRSLLNHRWTPRRDKYQETRASSGASLDVQGWIPSPRPLNSRDAEIKVKSPASAAASSIHNVAVSMEDLSLRLSVEGRLQPGEEHRGDVPLWGGSRRAARGAKGGGAERRATTVNLTNAFIPNHVVRVPDQQYPRWTHLHAHTRTHTRSCTHTCTHTHFF